MGFSCLVSLHQPKRIGTLQKENHPGRESNMREQPAHQLGLADRIGWLEFLEVPVLGWWGTKRTTTLWGVSSKKRDLFVSIWASSSNTRARSLWFSRSRRLRLEWGQPQIGAAAHACGGPLQNKGFMILSNENQTQKSATSPSLKHSPIVQLSAPGD